MDIIPVRKEANGQLLFRVNYDDTPEGFLDMLEDTSFYKLLCGNQALCELGHPILDNHVDPRIKLLRFKQIYPERVCGLVRMVAMDSDGFWCQLTEKGPHAHMLHYLDGIKKLFVMPRLIYNVDNELVDFITFDVVEVN